MKKLMVSLVMLLILTFSMAFQTYQNGTIDLVGTKWISPINDTCSVSLCFTSERNVLYNDCEDDWRFEVGYTIKGDLIYINVYEGIGNQMILEEDNGILRKVSDQKNSFPENFIKVPNSKCD